MASSFENVSMALFCDFENVALGVRDAKYDKFDIKPVLERLLLKGSIVVKKAYCDWDRYKGFKAAMHEANFELIEIPHVRQSGKNSADIRLVVDALDLCYTKSHVNTFVIISGDSDFSPLVSKLRENAKQVIGVGVKQSTSDLLIANCDEFIYYDDLVRESQRTAAKRETRETQPTAKRTPEDEKTRKEELEAHKTKAIDLAVETFEALLFERGDSGKIWASVLKEAIKRRKPGFNESYYGFRAFINLLEEAQARGLLEYGRDEKSNAYVFRSPGAARSEISAEAAAETPPALELGAAPVADEGKPEARRRSRGGRNRGTRAEASPEMPPEVALPAEPGNSEEAAAAIEPLVVPETLVAPSSDGPPAARRKTRGGRNRRNEAPAGLAPQDEAEAPPPVIAEALAAPAEAPAPSPAPLEKPAPRRRARSSRKTDEPVGESAPPLEVAAEVPPAEAPPPAEALPVAKAPSRSRRPRAKAKPESGGE